MRKWSGIALLVMGAAGLQTASAAAHRSVFALQSKPVRAQASILATSSSSRQSFAGGQDIYLVNLQQKNDPEPQFARLIDNYPGYGLPIRSAVLQSRAVLSMKVIRDRGCDVPGSEVFLPEGERDVYDASVRQQLEGRGSAIVPCYRTVHDSIGFAK